MDRTSRKKQMDDEMGHTQVRRRWVPCQRANYLQTALVKATQVSKETLCPIETKTGLVTTPPPFFPSPSLGTSAVPQTLPEVPKRGVSRSPAESKALTRCHATEAGFV